MMKVGFYERLRSLGQQFDPHVLEQTRAWVKELPRSGSDVPVQVTSLIYGQHERQRADIFSTADVSKGILAFVPGGGFVGGSRLGYRELGEHFARLGFVVAIADYRLAPEAPWPCGAEDVSAFIAALSQLSGDRGWAGSQLTLMGHSAGATHVASAAFDKRFNSAIERYVNRLVLVSGLYRFPFFGMADNVRAYIGTAEETYSDKSPLTHASPNLCPTLVIAAELDPAPFLGSAFTLAARLHEIGTRAPCLHYANQHNHISQVLSVGTPHDALSEVLMRFVSARD
jgi:acetyl esterase/lipase